MDVDDNILEKLSEKNIYDNKFFSEENIKHWAKIFKEEDFDTALEKIKEENDDNILSSFPKYLFLVWDYVNNKNGDKKFEQLLSYPSFIYFFIIFSKFMKTA